MRPFRFVLAAILLVAIPVLHAQAIEIKEVKSGSPF